MYCGSVIGYSIRMITLSVLWGNTVPSPPAGEGQGEGA